MAQQDEPGRRRRPREQRGVQVDPVRAAAGPTGRAGLGEGEPGEPLQPAAVAAGQRRHVRGGAGHDERDARSPPGRHDRADPGHGRVGDARPLPQVAGAHADTDHQAVGTAGNPDDAELPGQPARAGGGLGRDPPAAVLLDRRQGQRHPHLAGVPGQAVPQRRRHPDAGGVRRRGHAVEVVRPGADRERREPPRVEPGLRRRRVGRPEGARVAGEHRGGPRLQQRAHRVAYGGGRRRGGGEHAGPYRRSDRGPGGRGGRGAGDHDGGHDGGAMVATIADHTQRRFRTGRGHATSPTGASCVVRSSDTVTLRRAGTPGVDQGNDALFDLGSRRSRGHLFLDQRAEQRAAGPQATRPAPE